MWGSLMHTTERTKSVVTRSGSHGELLNPYPGIGSREQDPKTGLRVGPHKEAAPSDG